jgi:hypothetical protein
MQISQELLEYAFNLHAVHQPATLAGTYDGLTGEIVMTFENDAITYTVEFVYEGSSYNGFRETMLAATGEAVKQHNYNIGVPNRDAFIASVTE